MKESQVSIASVSKKGYPGYPYGPKAGFKELKNLNYKVNFSNGCDLYGGVREIFYRLGFDKKNYGKKIWNPLKGFVKKRDSVVIKPNLVIDSHPLGDEGVDAMITHASVIRPIIDYVLLATGGDCKITICDVPLQSADWEKMIRKNGLKKLVGFYSKKGIKIDLLDLRYEVALSDEEGHYYKRIRKIRDPRGYSVVDLGKKSYIQDIIRDSKQLEITDYGLGTVSKHHNLKKNEYLISNTILNSDVFINVPKMKTHRKAGVTLSMKNLIGINGDKSWIAHHRRGVDEYEKFVLKDFLKWRFNYYLKVYASNFINNLIRKMYRLISLKGKSIKEHGMIHGGSTMEGNWHGNDTVWRTILDLNNIIFFADKKGKMKKKPQRKYLSIVDGIIGMEKEGPMDGYPKDSGVLIGGFHPVSVDFVGAGIMGFDWKKIHYIREGLREKYWGLTSLNEEKIRISSRGNWKNKNLNFEPSRGWKVLAKNL